MYAPKERSKPNKKSIKKHTSNINKNILNTGIFSTYKHIQKSQKSDSSSHLFPPATNNEDTNKDTFFKRSKDSFQKMSPYIDRTNAAYQKNKFYGLFHQKDKKAFKRIINVLDIIDVILQKNSAKETFIDDNTLKKAYDALEQHCISYLNSYCKITFTKESRQRKALVQSILKKCNKLTSKYFNNLNEQKLIQYYNKPEFHTAQVHDPSNLKSFNSSPFNQAINADPESLSTILNNNNLAQESSEESSSSPYAIHFYDTNDPKNDIIQKNNIINYPNYIIKKIVDNKTNKAYDYQFKSLSQDYDNEDVKKPPVFETFFITNKPGKPKFSILAPMKHAYIGLRYTECRKIVNNLFYERKRLLIGLTRINKNTSDIDNECKQSNVATQTPIQITKVPKLLYSITDYFNRYKYKLLSRNCNTFVKNMAKSIGLKDISKIHSKISPSTSGNKIISAISKDAKKNKFGQFYKGWNSTLSSSYQIKPAKIMGEGISRYVLLGLNRTVFLQEVLRKLLRLDLGYKKQSSLLDSSFQNINPDSTTKINEDSIEQAKKKRDNLNFYKAFNSDYEKFTNKISNSFIKKASKQKNVKDILDKIQKIASQLDDIEIVLRSGKMLWEHGQDSIMEQIKSINELQIKIESAMQLCAKNKYTNSLLYLSEVRNMFEIVRYNITDFQMPKYPNSLNKKPLNTTNPPITKLGTSSKTKSSAPSSKDSIDVNGQKGSSILQSINTQNMTPPKSNIETKNISTEKKFEDSIANSEQPDNVIKKTDTVDTPTSIIPVTSLITDKASSPSTKNSTDSLAPTKEKTIPKDKTTEMLPTLKTSMNTNEQSDSKIKELDNKTEKLKQGQVNATPLITAQSSTTNPTPLPPLTLENITPKDKTTQNTTPLIKTLISGNKQLESKIEKLNKEAKELKQGQGNKETNEPDKTNTSTSIIPVKSKPLITDKASSPSTTNSTDSLAPKAGNNIPQSQHSKGKQSPGSKPYPPSMEILLKKQQPQNEAPATKTLFKRSKCPIAKIKNNYHNSCYFDSLMLQLYNIPELRDAFLKYPAKQDTLADYLKQIFLQVQKSIKTGESITLNILENKFKTSYPTIYNGKAQDSAEIYGAILKELSIASPDLYNDISKITCVEIDASKEAADGQPHNYTSNIVNGLEIDDSTINNSSNYLVVDDGLNRLSEVEEKKTITLKDGTKVEYSLIGCTLYQNNHYTSLVKDSTTNNWYYENDINPGTGFPAKTFKINTLSQKTPTLLFYKKVSQTPTKAAQAKTPIKPALNAHSGEVKMTSKTPPQHAQQQNPHPPNQQMSPYQVQHNPLPLQQQMMNRPAQQPSTYFPSQQNPYQYAQQQSTIYPPQQQNPYQHAQQPSTIYPPPQQNPYQHAQQPSTYYPPQQQMMQQNKITSPGKAQATGTNGRENMGSVSKGTWTSMFTDNENELRTNPEALRNLFIQKEDGMYVKTKDGHEVKAGTFHEYSVGGLKEQLKKQAPAKKGKGNGTISAIGANNSKNFSRVDVSRLQADPKYANNTVFVLASNFNALETIGNKDSIDDKYLSSYASDPTQGPIASISAPGTAFYRQYGIFRNKDNENNPLDWKQRNDGFKQTQGLNPKQLNLLEDLGINTQNGYVIDKPNDVYEKVLGTFKKNQQKNKNNNPDLPDGINLQQLPSNAKEAYNKFKIAYFSDCQVAYNNNDKKQLDKFYDKNQLVDQVCVAALAFDYQCWNHDPKLGNFDETSKRDQKSAKLVLKAQFEAIFRAAALHGKENVVIPIVGGGAFKNPQSWTTEALKELKDIIKKYNLNVIVNTFDYSRLSKGAKSDLKELVKETKGEYTIYK